MIFVTLFSILCIISLIITFIFIYKALKAVKKEKFLEASKYNLVFIVSTALADMFALLVLIFS